MRPYLDHGNVIFDKIYNITFQQRPFPKIFIMTYFLQIEIRTKQEIVKTWLFLHCPRFTNESQYLLLRIEKIIPDIFRKTNSSITSILLYDGPIFSAELNTNILNSSTDYILSSKRFESALFTET